jgi:hypothetical protein
MHGKIPRIARDGSGAFHRRHELRAVDAHTVVAGIEDDMHRFELTLHHDGRVVTAVEGLAIRWPWVTCGDAASALDAVTGMPLSTSSTAVGSWADATANCTHQFDLAGLAVAHAARHAAGGAATRSYLAVVPDWFTHPFEAWMVRDGVEVLRYVVAADGTLLAPDAFAGVDLNRRFIPWCNEHLDPDAAEAAVLLRRAASMSSARHMDLEALDLIGDSGIRIGTCYASQPQKLEIGRRNRHSLRDYGTHPQDLLAEFPTGSA